MDFWCLRAQLPRWHHWRGSGGVSFWARWEPGGGFGDRQMGSRSWSFLVQIEIIDFDTWQNDPKCEPILGVDFGCVFNGSQKGPYCVC